MWVDVVIRRIFGIQGPELKEYFDDLSLDTVVPQLITYFYGLVPCENIIWITQDEWMSQHQTDSTENSSTHGSVIQSSPVVWCHKPISTHQLRAYLKNFSSQSRLPQTSCTKDEASLVVPIRHYKSHEPIAYLLFQNTKSIKPDKHLSQISRSLRYMERHLSFSVQHWAAQKLSLMDDLTGLYNQRYLNIVLENEIYRSQREQKKFSVLFMDIDFFKSVNDTQGHLVGSRLLVEIGLHLKENLRKTDFAFRYGGDEFVVVLPHTDSNQAMVVAERIRSSIENTKFALDDMELKLTLSIGLATYPDHAKTCKDIIKMADEAMYCGKHKSRNIVFVAS